MLFRSVEKSLLQSYSEETVKLELPGEAPITIEFPGSELLLAAQPYSIRRLRTRAYGIHNSGGVPLRISAVTDESISSGVRGTSSSPWTFTCDDHMVWRAKNNFVHAYYEQGILGALAWATLLFGTIL